jgi:hypothetical protein
LATFSLSPGAYAKVSNKLQVSGSTINNFNSPVTYTVYSENRDILKEWTVYVHNAKNGESSAPDLLIYPNPSEGIVHLQFGDIQISPARIDIYNTLGEKVYTELISKAGNNTVEVDLTALPAGFYILKYSNSNKPVMIIIQ